MKNQIVIAFVGLSLVLTACSKPDASQPNATTAATPVAVSTPSPTPDDSTALNSPEWETRELLPDMLTVDSPSEFTPSKSTGDTGDTVIRWLTPDEQFSVLLRIYEAPPDDPEAALEQIAQSMASATNGTLSEVTPTEFQEFDAARFSIELEEEDQTITMEFLAVAMEDQGLLAAWAPRGQHEQFFESLVWTSKDGALEEDEEFEPDEDADPAEESPDGEADVN
jgi:hypothetical protein